MPFELDLRHEALNYIGRYARPTLELWGSGGLIVKGLLDALGPQGVTLNQIQLTGNVVNAADTMVTAQIPAVGVVKFGFDKMEINLANFTQAFFEALPQTMNGLVAWLVGAIPDFKFASHSFSYFSHSFVKDATPQQVLQALNVRELKTAGITLGNGAIYNYAVPAKKWETQLLIDKSQHIAGGLFVSLEIRIHEGELDFAQMMMEGRKYLADALAELELVIPETVA
jgi:hypothetical protein